MAGTEPEKVGKIGKLSSRDFSALLGNRTKAQETPAAPEVPETPEIPEALEIPAAPKAQEPPRDPEPARTTRAADTVEEPATPSKKMVGVRFDKKNYEKLQTMKIALGKDKDSPTLEWCFKKTWELFGNELKEKARQIEAIQNK